MAASLRGRDRPVHCQWAENCDADGNVLAAPCHPLANSSTPQPVPPDGLHQLAAAHAGQTDCGHRECWALSPLPSAAPPAHCQPGGGAHGEQPDEPGPAALHDGDDPPQPHRDQEQADAASQQAARRRTPRIAHHHHLLEDCKLGTCLATADSSQGLLVLLCPLAVPRHSKARDANVARYLVSPHRSGLVRFRPTASKQLQVRPGADPLDDGELLSRLA